MIDTFTLLITVVLNFICGLLVLVVIGVLLWFTIDFLKDCLLGIRYLVNKYIKIRDN